MADQLPTIPRFIFTVVEPISLLAGALGAFLNPSWFIGEQLTGAPPSPSSPALISSAFPLWHRAASLVALQLGNCYLLLMLVGLAVLSTTTELRVVRAYLVALALADVSHVGVTVAGVVGGAGGKDGGRSSWDWGRLAEGETWNAVTVGNVAFTTFLFVTRMAYFQGLFGPSAPRSTIKKD